MKKFQYLKKKITIKVLKFFSVKFSSEIEHISKSILDSIQQNNLNNGKIYNLLGNTYLIRIFFPFTKPPKKIHINENIFPKSFYEDYDSFQYDKEYVENRVKIFKENFRGTFLISKEEHLETGIYLEFDIHPNFSNFQNFVNQNKNNLKKELEYLKLYEPNINEEYFISQYNEDYLKASINSMCMESLYFRFLKFDSSKELRKLLLHAEGNFGVFHQGDISYQN